jgi:hypothetical protein
VRPSNLGICGADGGVPVCVRVRGQRMSKQRGATPEMPPGMPPGMMPPFGRFPPGFNPFMSEDRSFQALDPSLVDDNVQALACVC